MTRLSAATLDKAKIPAPSYDRDAAGIGIVHFGPGAFTRAHQAVYTEDAIARSGGDWAICAVSLNSPRAKKQLRPQDGLYTLAIRDQKASYRVIGAVREVLFAGDDRIDVMSRLRAPSTKFITLTITEKGYALDGAGQLDLGNEMIRADIADPSKPRSAMGFILLAAEQRLISDIPPFTVMSCDNLPDNGHRLRDACVALAKAQGKATLARHIRRAVRFPRTMVDAITPATDEVVLDAVSYALGLRDEAAVQRESFAQWVIEDDLPEERPDWVGAGATITDDIQGFENSKLRILNGAHSTLTYLGLLAGRTSVVEAAGDPLLRGFVDGLIREETIPSFDAPEGLSPTLYWDVTLARFDNPHIIHKLEQISHDGSQKIPARILPVIAAHGSDAKRAAFVAAGWIEWTRQRRCSDQPPTDGWLSSNTDALPDPSLSPKDYARAMLGVRAVFPAGLPVKLIVGNAAAIAEQGVIKAIKSLKL